MKNNTNILTGFKDLDTATSGLKKGDLIFLASRPSQGKTAMASNIAYNVAIKQKIPVVMFSIEQSGINIYKKMACAAAKIEKFYLAEDLFKKADWKALILELAKILQSPLYFYDKPDLNIAEISPLILEFSEKLAKQSKELGLIIIDYLQLIRSDKKMERRQYELLEITKKLKELAVKFNVPVLVCVQLNRNKVNEDSSPEISSFKHPQIADIADMILFIHREYYLTRNKNMKNNAEILIKKPFEKIIEINFNPDYISFSDKI